MTKMAMNLNLAIHYLSVVWQVVISQCYVKMAGPTLTLLEVSTQAPLTLKHYYTIALPVWLYYFNEHTGK